jgi:hypothetical protein
VPQKSKKRRESASKTGLAGASQSIGQGVNPMTVRRKWTFRLACVFLLPVLVVFGLEAALRLAGYGYSTSFFLKREIAGHKFLVENDKFGWRFFGPDLARTPRPMELPADKRSGTCRIFIFGESAAYGDPKPEFGFLGFWRSCCAIDFPGSISKL